MSYETIRFETRGPVAVIRLHRPHRMNAVIEEMYVELARAMERIRDDGLIRAAILTGCTRVKDGVEKQAFCAGADLKKHSAQERTPQQKRAYIELAHETTRQLAELPVPVIAAVNGPARGAGAEMAISCDLIFMAKSATIAFPETSLGTFIGGGSTYHLPRLVGVACARELVYTGRVVDGQEAVALGLATRVLPVEDLLDRALELAVELASRAPVSMAHAKRFLNESSHLDLSTAVERETEAILSCMETRDWAEGIRAFAEKRKPEFEGK